MGRADGQAKDPAWAAPICGVPAADIARIARLLPGKRVLVTVAHSLQRAEHGEQPVWMGAVLAAALGQLGLPGGGYAYALGTLAHYGKRSNAVPVAVSYTHLDVYKRQYTATVSPVCATMLRSAGCRREPRSKVSRYSMPMCSNAGPSA